MRAGQTVLVGGGAGNVGEAAVRLAAAAGLRVVATASGEGIGRARDAGAAVVVDHTDPQAHVPLPVSAASTHDISLVGFVISNATVADLADAAVEINHRLAGGTLTARITDVLPLSRAAEAHRLMEAGGVRGRIVLTP